MKQGPGQLTGALFGMKYCWRNMKLLRNEVSSGHEVKFAIMCAAHFIRFAYFIGHRLFHLPQANFIEKRDLLTQVSFFWSC